MTSIARNCHYEGGGISWRGTTGCGASASSLHCGVGERLKCLPYVDTYILDKIGDYLLQNGCRQERKSQGTGNGRPTI